MMLVLSMGIVPMQYDETGANTVDVAEILEREYKIIETFSEHHAEDIAKSLENSLVGALENIFLGAPPKKDLFAEGCAQIDAGFRLFIEEREMDGLLGIPTKAAIMGKTSRRKAGVGNTNRASFDDTGTYKRSFKSWVTAQ